MPVTYTHVHICAELKQELGVSNDGVFLFIRKFDMHTYGPHSPVSKKSNRMQANRIKLKWEHFTSEKQFWERLDSSDLLIENGSKF